MAAVANEIYRPCESELTDVLIVDLLQGAEALFVVSAAIAHPVAGLIIGMHETRGINAGRGGRLLPGRRRIGFRATTGNAQENEGASEAGKLFAGHEISCAYRKRRSLDQASEGDDDPSRQLSGCGAIDGESSRTPDHDGQADDNGQDVVLVAFALLCTIPVGKKTEVPVDEGNRDGHVDGDAKSG